MKKHCLDEVADMHEDLSNVSEWLLRARNIDKEIAELAVSRREAFELATNATSCISADKVQNSTANTNENKLINLTDYDLILSQKQEELRKTKAEIVNAIYSVNNSLYRTILLAYYINGKTWEQIAAELGYDTRWIYRLREKALKAIESHYNKHI